MTPEQDNEEEEVLLVECCRCGAWVTPEETDKDQCCFRCIEEESLRNDT